MTSTVTQYSSLINTAFPVPGADNDTQGFRDNFGNIRLSLERASTEITDLQVEQIGLISLLNNVSMIGAGYTASIVTSVYNSLTNTVPDIISTWYNTTITNAITSTVASSIAPLNQTLNTLVAYTGTFATLQSQITNNSATIVTLQSQITNNSATIVTLQSQITNNSATSVTLQSQITNNSATIVTLQSQITNNSATIVTLSNTVTTLMSNVVYYATSAPLSSKGTSGDQKGTIYASTNTLYICNASYSTGGIDIWSKVSLNGGPW